MHPHFRIVHLQCGWWRQRLTLFIRGRLDIAGALLSEGILAFRAEGSTGADTSDLSTQIVLLLAKEVRIGVNITFQVSGEKNLDGTSSSDVLGLELRKLIPRGNCGGRNQVSVFVYARASFKFCRALGSTFLIFACFTLGDVVIFFRSSDKAKEPNFLCTSVSNEPLKALL